jgi:hypothetical protein
VNNLTRRLEWVGHKFNIDNCFSTPDIFGDLHTRVINYCGIFTQTCKGLLGEFDNNTLYIDSSNIHAGVRGVLTATEKTRETCTH